ncbi:MAG: carbon starvation protein A, partial [Desulfovibrionales bacterium]|nr:carbon starvation protein A [Desulfovibrionales bacterium]
ILACIVLWTGAAYLIKSNKFHWLLSVPAMFMTCVCITYFMVAPHKNGGLEMSTDIAYWIGLVFSVVIALLWYFSVKIKKSK